MQNPKELFMKTIIALLAFSLFVTTPVYAGETVAYKDGETELEGYWVPSTCKNEGPAPTVLVIHQWKGLTDNEKMRADLLSQQCYNAFAVDMYGKGIHPADNDAAGKEAGIYKNDSALARRRITAALDYVRGREDVKKDKIAAIGYCFGGTMALELARSGADVSGVVSFHGGLGTEAPATEGAIKTPIQVHHGAVDPFITPEEFDSFVKEMNTSGADYTLTQYAHAVHSFTQKEAGDDPSKGAAYNEKADKRSWDSTLSFLKESFAD
jgi:dienelactone hydrolase